MAFPLCTGGADCRKWWNVDGLGYMRGKYLTPVQAIRLGAAAIRNSFKDQLKSMKQEGLDQIGKIFVNVKLMAGEIPCLMSEIGIPFDMHEKIAFRDRKYVHQYAAMDANNYALEGAGLSYTLWCYCSNVYSLPNILNVEFTQMG